MMDKKECCNPVSKAIFRIWDALKLHFVSCIICVGTVTTTNKINKKVLAGKDTLQLFPDNAVFKACEHVG